MLSRLLNCLVAVAMVGCLFFNGSAFSAPQDVVPDLPFDHMNSSTDGFATTATGNTQVDPPTTGASNGEVPPTAESPEPATITILGLGGLGAWWHMRRRKAAL
jgi:hypothetical protein